MSCLFVYYEKVLWKLISEDLLWLNLISYGCLQLPITTPALHANFEMSLKWSQSSSDEWCIDFIKILTLNSRYLHDLQQSGNSAITLSYIQYPIPKVQPLLNCIYRNHDAIRHSQREEVSKNWVNSYYKVWSLFIGRW